MSDRNEKIKRAVELTAGAPVAHVESSAVLETFRGQTVWQGTVEVYRLETPPPEFAYGWAVEGTKGQDYVAVLGNPPINSPLSAVRAWIVAQAKS